MAEYMMRAANILLVDDDERHAAAVRAILQYFGHSVSISVSRVEAEALIQSKSQSFDLMIVAYAMLEEAPNDFIREVRILSPDLPLLFFLDLDTQVAPESLGLLRIGTVLRKPIWGLELEETIQQFLAT